MTSHDRHVSRLRYLLAVLGMCAAVSSINAHAQEPAKEHGSSDDHAHGGTAGGLHEQLLELRERVARLEAALTRGHDDGAEVDPTSASHTDHGGTGSMEGMGGMGDSGSMSGMGSMGGMGMGMMGMGKMRKGKMRMGKMGKGKMGSGKARSGEMADMDTDGGMSMGMGMMGMRQAGMAKRGAAMKVMGQKGVGDLPGEAGSTVSDATPLAPLPSFAGAPGLYHAGSTGFYLDLSDLLSLTADQVEALSSIEAASLGEQEAVRLQVEELETEIWGITGSPSPDSERLGALVERIESLRSQMRLSFIRRVGAAAQVLTEGQRELLANEQDR